MWLNYLIIQIKSNKKLQVRKRKAGPNLKNASPHKIADGLRVKVTVKETENWFLGHTKGNPGFLGQRKAKSWKLVNEYGALGGDCENTLKLIVVIVV